MNNSIMPPNREILAGTMKTDNEVGKDFMVLADFLFRIKENKAFLLDGHSNFRQYLDNDIKVSPAIANKLVAIHEIFELGWTQSRDTLQALGFQKLCILLPLFKKLDNDHDVRKWMETAELNDPPVLKTLVDNELGIRNRKDPTASDILVQNWYEKWCAIYNCNKKKLLVKIAMYMMYKDIDAVIQETNESAEKISHEQELAESTQKEKIVATAIPPKPVIKEDK